MLFASMLRTEGRNSLLDPPGAFAARLAYLGIFAPQLEISHVGWPKSPLALGPDLAEREGACRCRKSLGPSGDLDLAPLLYLLPKSIAEIGIDEVGSLAE